MQWSEEASQLLNHYIDEVRRACHAKGLNPEPLAQESTQRMLSQAESSGVEIVSADLVRGILAAWGPAESLVRASVPPPLPPGGVLPPPLSGASVAPARRPRVWRGSSSTATGCVIGAVVCVGLFFMMGILAAIFIPALVRAREAAFRASCQSNLKELSRALQLYSDDHDGAYPLPSEEQNYLMFGGTTMVFRDLTVFQCPSEGEDNSEHYEDGSYYADSDYVYLGFAIRDLEELTAFVAACVERQFDMETLAAPGGVPGPRGDIEPLRANLPDPGSIPVMIEYAFHEPEGGNVAYLDGHVEFVKYGSKFPMTDEFFAAVNELWEATP
jgi:prepilin-type processing-associated H-X9-DG protein